MLFQNGDERLTLEILNYEFQPDDGAVDSDDRNWLVLRGAYADGDGRIIKDSSSCLLTYELQELTAGLKVLAAGIRDRYASDFSEPYFALSARDCGDGRFQVEVAFTMPNTMEDIDTAELSCSMTRPELDAVIQELDRACAKFPDRK